jgi:hypothetical protein
MAMRPSALNAMGDYTKSPPFAAFCAISEEAWDKFHLIIGGHENQDTSDRDYLFTRLTYISEVTSTAIRLNASWALTHPTMSLTRDRYEQIVRFSWLARQHDNTEIQKFVTYYHAAANRIFTKLKEAAKEEFNKMVDNPPDWSIKALTKEEKRYLGAWDAMDLLSMAKKRDALPGFGQSDIARQKLEIYYAPIYNQFSSVSHSDMYSVALLELHKNPQGQLVLAADPHWPATLAAFNSLFDTIQCYECAGGIYGKECEKQFQSVFARWHAHATKAFTG